MGFGVRGWGSGLGLGVGVRIRVRDRVGVRVRIRVRVRVRGSGFGSKKKEKKERGATNPPFVPVTSCVVVSVPVTCRPSLSCTGNVCLSTGNVSSLFVLYR
jgi:hypothetical protein